MKVLSAESTGLVEDHTGDFHQTMTPEPLTTEDRDLVHAAESIIRGRYALGRHHVGAALRSASGQIFSGLHLDSAGVDICAEAVALGAAATQGVTDVETIVAVQLVGGIPTVIPPCGSCRELFQTFAPDARAIVRADGGLVKVAFRDLLPCSYTSVRKQIKQVVQGGAGHMSEP